MDRDTKALEASVDRAIADCDGDARAAVRALIIANIDIHNEFEALKVEIARLTAAVSLGYARGRFRRGGGSAGG